MYLLEIFLTLLCAVSSLAFYGQNFIEYRSYLDRNIDTFYDKPEANLTRYKRFLTDEDEPLVMPTLEACRSTFEGAHVKPGSKVFFFSFDFPVLEEDGNGNVLAKLEKKSWLDARNSCRRQCLDTVALISERDWAFIKGRVAGMAKESGVWTSGRKYDEGYDLTLDAPQRPFEVFGWSWRGTNADLPPTNIIPPGWREQPWSPTGEGLNRQPDDYEQTLESQIPENCLAVLNDKYGDGVKWHDLACYRKLPYVCMESQLLIEEVEDKYGEKIVRFEVDLTTPASDDFGFENEDSKSLEDIEYL